MFGVDRYVPNMCHTAAVSYSLEIRVYVSAVWTTCSSWQTIVPPHNIVPAPIINNSGILIKKRWAKLKFQNTLTNLKSGLTEIFDYIKTLLQISSIVCPCCPRENTRFRKKNIRNDWKSIVTLDHSMKMYCFILLQLLVIFFLLKSVLMYPGSGTIST